MSENKGHRKSTVSLNSYISFAEGITLPKTPSGFDADFTARSDIYGSRLVIRKLYPIDNAFDNQFYEKARSVLETMQQLYEWALELPVFQEQPLSGE